jgi:general secretion pathway protein G
MRDVRPIPLVTRSSGFTLVEMIITVAIVALLASGALPLAELAVQRTKEQELRSALREIRGAIDAYKKAADDKRIFRSVDASGYPPSLSALVDGVEDLKHPQKQRIYFLRRIPRDPFAAPELPAEETWGKRSYQSPPDAPHDGNDVFDVYSLSERGGINGISYREW